MKLNPPWRVRVLAWGNVAIGFATPIAVGVNLLGALGVFSVEWARGSIILAILLGSILGYLTWSSGCDILRARPRAFNRTCVAGGLTFGYTFMGILIMRTAGIDRGLEILIRHGSQDWWNWSLSHFQNSALREIPLMAWWVLGLGTVVRYQIPGAPKNTWDRIVKVLGLALGCAMVGGLARVIQLAEDTLLSSQR
jgi:hypothetical protein